MSYSLGNYSFNYDVGASPMAAQPTMDVSSSGGSMGPAAVMVGGQFLTNYLAQQAAADREKRKTMTDLALRQGDVESQYMQNLVNTMRQALLR